MKELWAGYSCGTYLCLEIDRCLPGMTDLALQSADGAPWTAVQEELF